MLHDISSKLEETRDIIVNFLKKIPEVQLLEPSHDTFCVNSIVTFYIKNNSKYAEAIREFLVNCNGNNMSKKAPITLPKVIKTPHHDYLRFVLDPKRVTQLKYQQVVIICITRIEFCDQTGMLKLVLDI